MKNKNISPWAWIPTLYFAQGLPYVAVMTISVIMYKNLGISNTDIALYTSWLYLPWVIKPFWSPFVDLLKTKRWWIVSMQLLVGAGLAGIAFTIPMSNFFQTTLAIFWLVAFSSATHDIAADGFYMLALNVQDQALYVGIRSTFYRIATIAGQGLLVMLAGGLEIWTGSIKYGWSITFFILAGLFLAFCLYHKCILPKPDSDKAVVGENSASAIFSGFIETFASFFRKKQARVAILFMLFYRFPEAQLVKLINPFLLDPIDKGGLGLTTTEVGLVYGTIGIIGLTLGGIIGGICAAKGGLQKWLWPMAWSLSLTCLTFVYLGYFQPQNFVIINLCVFIEQFGYGFGFTAYMLYLIYYSDGEHKTAHYAICTAFMALGMMLPGMAAGWLQELIGYENFFIWVMVCCTATIAVCAFIKIDPSYGKKADSPKNKINPFLFTGYLKHTENMTYRRSILKLLLTFFVFMTSTLLSRGAEPGARPPRIRIKTGIEVLKEQNFKCLEGKRVGLITNPTGVDNHLISTIDILHEAPNVNLVALYGPEHGVRGDVHAGDKVDNANDSSTGLPVYSLYGKTRKPTPEMLKDIDVLVYDIQDIGCRSFTYISTMGVAMEAAAENNKEFIVLDRPNPIGGLKIEGNVVEDGYISFVSQFKIPYLYGLTCGELALMLNGEQMLSKPCNLHVVKMKGWKRKMDYVQTGLQWIPSSPHIPHPHSAFFYPVSGILGELGYMSIGVGYTIPFQMFAAPWVEAEKLADNLNRLHLPGVIFRPMHLKPFYSVGKEEHLQGVQVHIVDFNKASLSEIQFYVMQEVTALYPDRAVFDHADKERFHMFDLVSGSKEIRERFSQRNRWEDVRDYWYKDVDDFRQLSQKYYLYK